MLHETGQPPADDSSNRPVIVGIAAMSASLPSVVALLDALPEGFAGAIVILLRDRGAADLGTVVPALVRPGRAPARIAADRTLLEADGVYVVPSDMVASFEGARLRIAAAGRGALDGFLTSLAEQHRKNAIAILLEGGGPDGALGIAAVKAHGGLSLAEARGGPTVADEAQPGVAEGGADYVIPASGMARHVVGYVDHLLRMAALSVVDEGFQPRLARIATILRGKTGHDFHGYKPNTFFRRVRRRMQVVQMDDIDGYIDVLKTSADEVQNLFHDLLIGVTQFFRDPAEFSLLEREVVPQLFAGKTAADHLRIWVLGCATGEEAYSIAILLREYMATLDVVPQVQIFATDIDARALTIARTARFPAAIAADMSPERLARWFVREGNTYCVTKELREMCVFSAHNLIKDAPFSRIDLITCRNLLIYLSSDLQDQIIPLFHFALKPGGCLFLGPSENVTRHARLFTALDRRHRVFRRQDAVTRPLTELPLGATAGGQVEDGRPPRQPTADTGLAKRAERLAERHAPAYVVVDGDAEILHFSGRTGRYLEPSAGAANLNLLNLVHRDLRLDLQAGLRKASTRHQMVKVDRLAIGEGDEQQVVNLVIEPLAGAAGGSLAFVVLFQDVGSAGAAEQAGEAGTGRLRDDHVQRLEGELRLMKERLQSTIEELETTNEELKSSNEEYQAINEELQSANEELETSKEELQSVNEELRTVNSELAYRVNELAKANSDLKNLLESTQIATIFLDNDLRVNTFTPSATDIFHLIETDLGRPLAHIAARIVHDEMEEDVRRVLRTLKAVEREVGDPRTGARYLLRVLPYRSIDNFIAGAVLTFLDITAAVRAEEALRKSEQRLALAQAAAHIGTWTRDAAATAQWWSPTMYELHGLPHGDTPPADTQVAFHDDDERDRFTQAIAAAFAGPGDLNIEYRVRHRLTGERWLASIAQVESHPAVGQPAQLVGVTLDISDQKQAERRSAMMLADLQHRVRNTLGVVRSLAARSLETSRSLEDFRIHFEGRLGALGRTHGVLARLTGGEVDLEELIRDELLAQAVSDDQHLLVAGPRVSLRQKAAELFGLALHELATNAVKYGALSSPPSDIAVTWRIFDTSQGQRLTLEWLERNARPQRQRQRRRGFGSTLIQQGLPYELGGASSLEITPDGVRCIIELPIEPGLATVRPEVD